MAFDWKKTLGNIAPWIATTLGGPGAGLAVEGLCRLVGLSPSHENAQKAAQAIAAGQLTGEQFLALQCLEAEHKEKMQAMGYKNISELEDIAYKDRDSARNMAIQLRDVTPRILAYAVTTGFFSLLCFMLVRPVPQESKDILNIMLGALGAAWVNIIGFYFGSSAGSERKTELMGQKEE